MNKIIHGDCIEMLKTLEDSSVDSIVTDPPYELGFMGKHWDSTGIANSVELWRECLRVLKPGGHLLAFSGSRTYHRMTCAIEDAGFEIRDQIMWIYGSGFPKSLDVSKAIDKAPGAERERYERPAFGGTFSDDNGTTYGTALCNTPATDAARQWHGWGTALKPAHEPICMARKPLIGTIAENVLAHGTGALNIDGCRVGSEVRHASYTSFAACSGNQLGAPGTAEARRGTQGDAKEYVGRWPANLIHDGSEEVLRAFPDAPCQLANAKNDGASGDNRIYGSLRNITTHSEVRIDGSASAARFFYCAKASRADRNEGLISSNRPATGNGATMRECEDSDWKSRNGNHHPTVKPTDLMRYLCRLVTPPGGTVLDPFMGSGSTGKAAVLEGFGFIGIDQDQEYVEIAKKRIEAVSKPPNISSGDQPDLFAEVAA